MNTMGHTVAVNLAELKARLKSYLQRVRAGKEIVIRDRNLATAELVPLHSSEVSPRNLHWQLPASSNCAPKS